MRKIAGVLFAVLAVSLVLLPTPALAGSLDKDCSWEKVKWEENPNSCFLYLDNWEDSDNRDVPSSRTCVSFFSNRLHPQFKPRHLLWQLRCL